MINLMNILKTSEEISEIWNEQVEPLKESDNPL
jgi:hypothetical protein